MYKPISETHANEILSDNTGIRRCNQCEDCVFWGSDNFSNKYDKACCDQYPYPGFKPYDVINNTGDCRYRLVGR